MASSLQSDLQNIVEDFKGNPVQQLVMAVCGTRDVNHPDYIGNRPSQHQDIQVTLNNHRVTVALYWNPLTVGNPCYTYLNRADRIYHPEDPVCAEHCTEPEEEWQEHPEEVRWKNGMPYVEILTHLCLIIPLSPLFHS